MPPGVPGSEIKGQKPGWLSGGGGWVQPHPRHHELDTFFLAWSRSNVHTVMLTGRWGVGRICKDFPSAPLVPNPLCNAGDMGLIPVGGSAIPGATEQLSRPAQPWSPRKSMRSLQKKVCTEQQTSCVPPQRPSAAKQTGLKIELKPGTLRSAHPPP